MTLKEKQLEFIIYCIENTAERLGRYSADVYNKLRIRCYRRLYKCFL